MNKIQLIKHPQLGEIRTHVDKKGNVLFCLLDVCEVLGIENDRNVKKRLSLPYVHTMDVGVVTGKKVDGSDAIQIVPMTFIGEPNLYKCIFQSRKPEAVKFQDWVFEEVLPSIRKFGYYVHPSYMAGKDYRKLGKNLSGSLKQYIYEEDYQKTAKKFGISKDYIRAVINAHIKDNAVMQELQCRALLNRENEINAYSPDRILEVVKKLSK